MKTFNKLAALAVIPVAILSLNGCSSSKTESSGAAGSSQPQGGTGQGSTTLSIQPGEPGGTAVGTYQETATVTRVDKDARTLTLQPPGGPEVTFKAGPEVVNFNQIEPGDKVRATVTEQLVVFVRDSKEPPKAGQSGTIALAPVGAKPGAVMSDTVEITAKVVAIDLQRHMASVQLPDGQVHTFKVRPDVDLTKRRVGEEVVMRSTQALAIRVEKE